MKTGCLFALIFSFMLISPVKAEWKQESLNNVQVHYYLPKVNGFLKLATKKALMINLHGCSQKAEDLKKDGNWENSADEFNMIVALPKVPNGGVIAGCWDYYGADHTETNRHNGAVLSVVKALLAKPELNIDPNQVYISGLSSGGGLSMVLGCLSPDVFAGMGLNAGPSTGTSSNEIGRPKTSYETMLNTCKKLASTKSDFFKTQLTSIIYGSNDFIVSPTFNTNNAEIMRTIYGANNKTSFDTKKLEGTNTDGSGTLWADERGPRVSLIMNTNLGHNWPAGQGGNGGSFINKKSINYPHYLAEFFSVNNRRSNLIVLPELMIEPVIAKNSQFHISGELRIPKTQVSSIKVIVSDKKTNKVVEQLNVTTNRDNRFLAFTKSLPDGEYEFSFEMNSAFGFKRFFKRQSWLGEVQGINAPQLVNTTYQSVKGCLLLKGQAVASDGGTLRGVTVQIDNNSTIITDIKSDSRWSYKACDLNEGEHTVLVYTEGSEGLRSNSQQYTFKIAGNLAVATLQEHMEAKRLNWADFGTWYLRYGNQHIALYLGEDGIWKD
jgi:poly(3-hydroxybutyrate) depolymerase